MCRLVWVMEPAERTPRECRKFIVEESGCVILDVRTPEEYSRGHIEGAENIDYFSPAFPEIIACRDKAGKYLVYCKTGERGKKTCNMMTKQGFPFVITIRGGIVGWQEEGLPVMR